MTERQPHVPDFASLRAELKAIEERIEDIEDIEAGILKIEETEFSLLAPLFHLLQILVSGEQMEFKQL